MKIHGKKYGISSTVLFLGAMIIGVCFFMVLLNTGRKAELERSSRGFRSEYAKAFMVTEYAPAERLQKTIQSTVTDGMIYMCHLDADDTLQAVWYQGEADIPKLESGRFFREEDFSGTEKFAVVGKGYLQEKGTEPDSRKITIDEEQYQIIGVLDAKPDTRMGQMCFINWNAAIIKYGTAGDYLLDGKKKSIIADEMKKLSERMYSDELYYSEGETENTGVVRVFGLETLDAIYLIMSVNFIICGIFISLYWLQKQKKYAEVYSLMGLKRRWLITDVTANYIKIAFTGLLAGAICLYAGNCL